MAEKKLTVLQVLPALQSGGVERGTLELGKYLVEQGHRSLVMSSGGRLVEQLAREGSKHFSWDIGKKSLWTLRLIGPLRSFLTEHKVDILHVRSRMPAWIGYLAWKGMKPSSRPHFITTVHGMNSVGAYSRIMTRGEIVIAVSNTLRDYILRHYPDTPADRIRVIHRGVSGQEFPYGYQPDEAWKYDFFTQFPNSGGKMLISLPGRITRLKGHEAFVELMARLIAEGRAVHGLIVGGASESKQRYLNELKQLVHTRGLDSHITFTGQRQDLKNILAISNLVLSLSTQPESFGRTTLEALRLGIPTAGYDHGGVGEILHAVYPAGCLPLHDSTAVMNTIRHLLDTPLAVPQGDFFPLSDMLEKTLNTYVELAGAQS